MRITFARTTVEGSRACDTKKTSYLGFWAQQHGGLPATGSAFAAQALLELLNVGKGAVEAGSALVVLVVESPPSRQDASALEALRALGTHAPRAKARDGAAARVGARTVHLPAGALRRR